MWRSVSLMLRLASDGIQSQMRAKSSGDFVARCLSAISRNPVTNASHSRAQYGYRSAISIRNLRVVCLNRNRRMRSETIAHYVCWAFDRGF